MKLETAVDRASKIPGWMEEEELAWLGEQAAKHKVIVEIGTWYGRSTKVMSLMTKGKVYSVDNLSGESPGLRSKLERGMKKNLSSQIKSDKVELLRMSSLEACRTLQDVDMVFLDGDHSYESMKLEIPAWGSVTNVLCGHDYGSDEGVTRAIQELLVVENPIGTIWTTNNS